jgi:hypothetical protein
VSETSIQSQILDALKANGYWAFRINAGGRHYGIRLAPKGTPDICVVWPHGWLEVKRPANARSNPSTTAAQQAWRDKAKRLDVRLAQVVSVDDALEAVRLWERADEY